MNPADILRLIVAALAAVVSGSTLVVFAIYVRAWVRAPSGAGILPQHVALVSLGTLGLVVGVGFGVYDGIGVAAFTPRLWVYLVSLLLILAAVVQVGKLQRRRFAENRPDEKRDEGKHRA